MPTEMLPAGIRDPGACWCVHAVMRRSVLQTAVAAAAAKGVLFVSSAGNDHSSNDVTPHWPSNIATDTTISVAALDKTGGLWYASAAPPDTLRFSTHLHHTQHEGIWGAILCVRNNGKRCIRTVTGLEHAQTLARPQAETG